MTAAPAYSPPPGSIPTLEVPALEGIERVHLVGIGGAGMRNLAKLLVARGVAVSGSDLKDSKGLRELVELGVRAHVGHDASRIGDPNVLVASSAIAESNPEVREAHRRGIPVWARAQTLAAYARGRRSIAVAGTHGKTTTTSMVAVILDSAGLDPSYLVGGDLNESGSGARAGGGDLFVFEADESDGSFLLARPAIGVITNVELDHVDFYPGGLAEIESAFAEFALGCERVVAFGDDPAVGRILAATGVDAVTYGTDAACSFRLRVDSVGLDGGRGVVATPDGEVTLSLPMDGVHNLLDATAAIACGWLVGVDPQTGADALMTFGGVHRRFELRGSARGAEFFDDYGHTPTEMSVTLEVARRRRPGRIVAVVQPHRYSRVRALWRELGASVVEADLVLVTDIDGAAQPPIPGVTGRLVAEGAAVAAPGKRVVYLPHRADVVTFLDHEVREGDLVITMGCGDVWMVGDAALARIRGDDPGRDGSLP